LALVLAVTALGFLLIYLLSHHTSQAEPTAPIKSIAVIPFKDLTGDATQEYFSDGLAESFITQLSRVSGLRVLSRTSAFTFKGKKVDPRAIGRDLGVQAILEGSIRRSAENVRIEARLVSTDDGRVIWASEAYDRTLKDIFAVQDEIACNVAASLRVRFCGERSDTAAVKRGVQNVDAYEAYLKGQYYLNKRTNAGINKAIAYFQQTIAIDPDYAPAYSGLADCYFQSLYLTPIPQSQLIAEGKTMARKALTIDETLGEAHAFLSILSDAEWNWDEAVKEGRLAVSLSPGSARAHHLLAFVLSKRGYFDEGLAEIRKAHELDPLNLVIDNDIAEILCFTGRYDEAIEQCNKTLELDPNFPLPYVCLTIAYWGKGMYAEAIKPIQRAVELDERAPYHQVQLATAYGFAGERGKAKAALTKLKAQARTEYIEPLWIAGLYASIGDNNEALSWIEKACDQRSRSAVGLPFDVRFAALWSEPRYKAALAGLGLTPR